MKKILALAMALSVLGSIVAGCGAKEEDAAATAGAATTGGAMKDSAAKPDAD